MFKEIKKIKPKKFIEMDAEELDGQIKSYRLLSMISFGLAILFVVISLFTGSYSAMMIAIIIAVINVYYYIDLRHIEMLRFFHMKMEVEDDISK